MQFLNIDQSRTFKMPLRDLIGESVAVLGIKGSGKTNTAAVLIEELLSYGLPLTIVDIEGEYWGLKERFEILVVGRSDNVDMEVGVPQAERIAEFSVTHGISVILDLSDFGQDEMLSFLLRYFKSLWAICFQLRKPYEIVLEEAHEFVPQSVRTPLKEVLTRIALRGRKRGLGIISVSQRSAKVEKDVLTQASILFLHRVVHPIDVKVYQEILPLPPREVEHMVGELQPGQAIILSEHKAHTVQIRLRHTFHVGATPELVSSAIPKLRKIDKALLAELRKHIVQIGEAVDDRSQRINQLEEQLTQKELEIEALKTQLQKLELQVELLSRLQVSLSDAPTIAATPSGRKVSSLDVEQIRTDQLITQGNQAEKRSIILTELPKTSEAIPALNLVGEVLLADTQTIKKQQRRFTSLIQDIKKLPRFHRSILRFLVEREGVVMSTRDLSKWLNLSEGTIRNRPPLELVKMGLIARSGRRGSYNYSSALSKLLKAEFPNLEAETLTEQLLAAC